MDNLFSGSEAREKMMAGVRKAAQAVGITLGTSGKNSIIEAFERPGYLVTNDGYTIINSIHFDDPLEDLGRKQLCEAINRANRSSGDGSSTTCILTAAILEEGAKYLGKTSPMHIKRSLEEFIPKIEEAIGRQKKEITLENVADVAAISAEDEGIGKLIQEIYQKIGKNGVIQWDISKTPEDSYTLGTGITIHDATYVSSYMCDENSKEARLINPAVLLMRKKITTALEFESLFKEMFQQGERQIVIFCEDIDIPVIADLLQTQRIQGFRSVVVKVPVLWQDEWWEDLALASGGKIVDQSSGINLAHATSAILGHFGHVTVGREETLIEGIEDITNHILALKVDGTDEALQRAERLNTRTARYFVGAYSESALAYRRLKVEDAINAASCALENGVVAGGGIALLNVSNALGHEIGASILYEALKAPFRQILENAGLDATIAENTLKGATPTEGFDSRTGDCVDMLEAGIVDPVDVVINAVKNAIGVAAAILTTGTVITLPKEMQPVMQPVMQPPVIR